MSWGRRAPRSVRVRPDENREHHHKDHRVKKHEGTETPSSRNLHALFIAFLCVLCVSISDRQRDRPRRFRIPRRLVYDVDAVAIEGYVIFITF